MSEVLESYSLHFCPETLTNEMIKCETDERVSPCIKKHFNRVRIYLSLVNRYLSINLIVSSGRVGPDGVLNLITEYIILYLIFLYFTKCHTKRIF